MDKYRYLLYIFMGLKMNPLVILCLFIPLIGTTLGSAMVFFLRKEINPKLQKVLLSPVVAQNVETDMIFKDCPAEIVQNL